MFAEILAPHFSVATAKSAPEADAWLQRKPLKVIVADHSMPGEKGLALLARVRVTFELMQRVLATVNLPPAILCLAHLVELLFALLFNPLYFLEFIEIVHTAAEMPDTLVSS